MASDLISAIDAWKKAVALAQAAEKFLDRTWQYHLDGRGPAATGGLVEEVAQFRARAQARLAAAMALMRSIDECPSPTAPIRPASKGVQIDVAPELPPCTRAT